MLGDDMTLVLLRYRRLVELSDGKMLLVSTCILKYDLADRDMLVVQQFVCFEMSVDYGTVRAQSWQQFHVNEGNEKLYVIPYRRKQRLSSKEVVPSKSQTQASEM